MRQKIYSSSNRSFENKNQSARPLDEDFLHTENLILIYEYRHIRCVYDGLKQYLCESFTAWHGSQFPE
jgi:hypothetical protein